MASFYNPNVIALVPGTPECLDWCRRSCPDKDLRGRMFVYRHVRSGNFMLAYWVSYRTLFTPILEIGTSLAAFGRLAGESFLRFVHPQREDAAAAALQQASDNARSSQESLNAERVENRARLLRDECGIRVRHEDGGVFAPTDMLAG